MKKLISIALALLMIAVMLPVMAMAEGANVAKIGNTEYATLKDAFDAVKDGETIVVMKNCSGDGIVVNSGKNFTVTTARIILMAQQLALPGLKQTVSSC